MEINVRYYFDISITYKPIFSRINDEILFRFFLFSSYFRNTFLLSANQVLILGQLNKIVRK